MKITLLSLLLENFKGIQKFELSADGKNINVFGTNASGKTTLADAYYWLLFGKDSSGIANFDVKTIGTSGLDYGVQAVISVDGQEHTLRRTLNEKWERKNGETEKKLKGNTTTYIIDGVPVKEKDYKSFIENNLVCEKTYQMLTDPDCFAGKTDWKKRRELLLEWFANVSDEDIISSHEKLKPLLEILDGRTVEDSQKLIQMNRKAVNDLLKEIPSRIDEQQKNITAIQESVNGDEQKNLDRLLKEKEQLESNIRNCETDENLNKAKAAVEEIKLEIIQAKNAYMERNSSNDKTEQQILTLKREKIKVQSDVYELTENINSLNEKLEQIVLQGKKFNDDFLKISAEQYEGSQICPCCGQLLPEDKIQSAVAEFNFRKSERLENIKAECVKLKAERSNIKDSITKHQSEQDQKQKYISDIEKSVATLESSIIKPVPFEETEEYEKLSIKLRNAEEKVEAETICFKENISDKIAGDKARVTEINRQCSELRNILAKQNTLSMHKKRISDLKEQEKEYGLMLAKSDKELMLIDEFVKTKCSEVEKMINSHFKIVKWKLFDLQVNGGIADCCEATVDGVDYSTNLNSAAKLNAGLDIIKTISGVTDTYVPIWIDNAESVVDFIDTDSQTIRLVVSEEYQNLTVKE